MGRLVQVLSALAVVSGCQCFQPVDENPDGGRVDAGQADGGTRDAGSFDAGSIDAGRGCDTAADCPGGNPTQQFCGQLESVCVNRHCLLECPGGDAGTTCQSDTTQCLSCNGAVRECGCNANVCNFTALAVGPDCPAPFDDFRAFIVQPFSGRCGGAITSADGGLHGVWLGQLPMGRMLFDIPELGGACIGSPLSSQVPRTLISCPACTFVSEGC